jgi:hypothetical protein
LLRVGEVHPQLIVMAAAQAAGEMGAGLAVAGEDDLERVLGELAAILRQAGREHGEALAVAVAVARRRSASSRRASGHAALRSGLGGPA